ncbi:unnamed protein product [Vitrella brassicaformis CCMP3155]|uniref:Lipocalin/cytosolic fatty-acid binding domain-containing protein n=1 Tax=Vitrella brassicaformis (strain CCMP3155) TaxID=1169540 RepID=A0A0G4G8S8_VITBC|nr:unnamed protein product [Vitrella brassicaformis CCMP3155]|eukprot:CEM25251.1 unnamed protein product [Vitrella brassicaformis CCMP3155]
MVVRVPLFALSILVWLSCGVARQGPPISQDGECAGLSFADVGPAVLKKDEVVMGIDIDRYTGLWYQIADSILPRCTFGVGCSCTGTLYEAALDADTDRPFIEVNNICRREIPVPPSEGRADPIEDPDSKGLIEGRLYVQFAPDRDELTFPPTGVTILDQPEFFFSRVGNYWIIYLEPAEGETLEEGKEPYEIAVIGSPDNTTLFILSRKPEVSDEDYERILQAIVDLGYDLDTVQLKKTEQGGDCPPLEDLLAEIGVEVPEDTTPDKTTSTTEKPTEAPTKKPTKKPCASK